MEQAPSPLPRLELKGLRLPWCKRANWRKNNKMFFQSELQVECLCDGDMKIIASRGSSKFNYDHDTDHVIGLVGANS